MNVGTMNSGLVCCIRLIVLFVIAGFVDALGVAIAADQLPKRGMILHSFRPCGDEMPISIPPVVANGKIAE